MHHQATIIQSQKGVRCPWCGVNVLMKFVGQSIHQRRDEHGEHGQLERNWAVSLYECPACGEVNVHVHRLENLTWFVDGVPTGPTQDVREGTVYPSTVGRGPLPPEVPAPYSSDYKEACAIIDLSPQASAALSRRLLQALLRGPGQIPKKRDLQGEIDAAIATGLRADISEQLHMVRIVGNFAAHPIKDAQTGTVLPVEPAEAEHLLGVIELLFDFYFVAPAKTAAMKATVNAKLGAAGKPPLL